MIQHIIFDVGKVLCLSQKRERLKKARERWGADFKDEDFKKMMHPAQEGRDFWREYQNGKISTDEYLSAAVKAMGKEPTSDEKNHFGECLRIMAGCFYSPMLDLVRHLAQKGYTIGILTNNNELMFSASEPVLRKIATQIFSSHQVGFSKPDPRIYILLLKRLGATETPETVLYIDDKEKNLIPPREMGMEVFLFPSRSRPIEEAYQALVDYLTEKKIF